jgi:hypothetical protein
MPPMTSVRGCTPFADTSVEGTIAWPVALSRTA